MTYIPNQGTGKDPKILNFSVIQTKPTTITINERYKSLDLNSYTVTANSITLNLKAGYEYLIETYSHQTNKITDATSNDANLIIKKNFADLYRGYATFYLEKDTIITLARVASSIPISFGVATQSIATNEIIVYGV